MVVPSITTLVLGFVITVALAVADWYVWRSTPERPFPMAPTGPHFNEAEETSFKKVA